MITTDLVSFMTLTIIFFITSTHSFTQTCPPRPHPNELETIFERWLKAQDHIDQNHGTDSEVYKKFSVKKRLYIKRMALLNDPEIQEKLKAIDLTYEPVHSAGLTYGAIRRQLKFEMRGLSKKLHTWKISWTTNPPKNEKEKYLFESLLKNMMRKVKRLESLLITGKQTHDIRAGHDDYNFPAYFKELKTLDRQLVDDPTELRQYFFGTHAVDPESILHLDDDIFYLTKDIEMISGDKSSMEQDYRAVVIELDQEISQYKQEIHELSQKLLPVFMTKTKRTSIIRNQ